MIRINEIIEQIRSYHPNADIQSVMKAYVYSAKVHAGQVRKSGEPYLSHPLAVTGLLAEMHLDVGQHLRRALGTTWWKTPRQPWTT